MKSPLPLGLLLLFSGTAGWSASVLSPWLVDAHWDSRFGLPGVQGNVLAMAFNKKHIYVGGQLQGVGQTAADAVAEFDGRRWKVLPDGPQQHPVLPNVMALEMFRNRLYVGGFFTNVAGQATGGLASWHQEVWSVPGGTNGVVYALRATGDGLLVAGRFTLPGWTNPVALARFDGKNGWEILNSELPPPNDDDIVSLEAVEDFEVLSSQDIVALLPFRVRESWGGWTAPSFYLLLRCDTNNNWSRFPAPSGDPNDLNRYALGRFRDGLVAGGNFTNATNLALRNIARWSGDEWQPLGQGLEGEVWSVAGDNRAIYALHRVSEADDLARAGVSRWDGTRWTLLGTVHDTSFSYGRLFLSPNGQIYLSGLFSAVNSVVSPGLIRWDGQRWEPLFEGACEGVAGLINTVFNFIEHKGEVYMGGAFLTAGRQVSPGLARWNGFHWHDVGGSVVGSRPRVTGMVSSGAHLYVTGSFTNIGGTAVRNIGRWDGSKWHSLGEGIPGNPFVLTWWRNSLYAGGRFNSAGDLTTENVAKWDGTSWQPLGEGCNSNVNTLVVWRDNLYAGGRFTSAGGRPVSLLACWNGETWDDIGGGVAGDSRPSVSALAAAPNGLYVAGQFRIAGAISAANVARWDGTNWHALGNGYPGSVSALAVRGDILYAGGHLTNAAGLVVGGLLRWDGTTWSTLGSGVDDPRGFTQVHALLGREDDLLVGGLFSRAGGKPSANVARWVENPRLRIAHESTNPRRSPRLQIHGEPGLNLRLETSNDLSIWRPVQAECSDSGEWFLEEIESSLARYFRTLVDHSPPSPEEHADDSR